MSESKFTAQLTDEQKVAVMLRDASAALSAGAGCGKTTVLTNRFLNRLEDAELRDLMRLVGVTFTEKAARELRGRVRAACWLRIQARDEDSLAWKRTLRGLEAASIGTFHGFCGKMLRRWAIQAGIDPGFHVMDEILAPTFREEALSAVMRRALAEEQPDLISLCQDYGLDQVRDALETLIRLRTQGDLALFATQKPEEISRRWIEFWHTKGLPDLVRDFVATHDAQLQNIRRYSCSHPVMQARLATIEDVLLRLGALASSDRPDEARVISCLEQIQEQARVIGGGGVKDWSAKEGYEQARDRLKDMREDAVRRMTSMQWSEESTQIAANRAVRFARMATAAIAEYDACKWRESMIDFDDLLIFVRNLLVGDKAVLSAERASLDMILVDEFQDTDPIQGRILEALAGDDPGSGRLFFVGDVKQSIYRFRRAQPRVFEDFRARFPAKGRLFLRENFRSVPELLDFFNLLFGDIYRYPEEALLPGHRTPPRADRATVDLVWTASYGDDGKSKPLPAAERREREAVRLAQFLRDRLAAGWIIRDPITGTERNAKPGDVAVLFRALTDIAIYERAFLDASLESHVMGGRAFYSQQEIQDVINLLSVLEDPHDELALAAILRSPFFSISDEGLYWISAQGKGDFVLGLSKCRDDPPEALAASDHARIHAACGMLERWRLRKDRVGIAVLLEAALEESGYEISLMTEHLGERKRANVRKLVGLARRHDASGRFTLADFTWRLRTEMRRPPREEQAAITEEQGDYLRMMSIHQAKGLEFPIVVLPDLNRAVMPQGLGRVALHPDLGLVVGPAPEDDVDSSKSYGSKSADMSDPARNLGWRLYRDQEAREEDEEAIRVFYVACTRARDALVLSAALAPEDSPASPMMIWLHDRINRVTGEWLIPPKTIKARDHDGLDAESVIPFPKLCVTVYPQELEDPTVEPAVTSTTVIASPKRGGGRAGSKVGQAGESVTMSRKQLAKLLLGGEPTAEWEQLPQSVGADPRVLNLNPVYGLSPRAKRVESIIRAVLAHEQLLVADQWTAVWSQAKRMQIPYVPENLAAEALSWITPAVLGRLDQWKDEATCIYRALPWTLVLPPEAPSAVELTVHGLMDFLFVNDRGDGVLVNVGTEQSEISMSARVRLSAKAARETLGVPIVRGVNMVMGATPAVTEVALEGELRDVTRQLKDWYRREGSFML